MYCSHCHRRDHAPFVRHNVCYLCDQHPWTQLTARRREKLRALGLDRDSYSALVTRANGLCEACGERPWTDVDHDHKTGAVRGLLCGNCNTGLGHFRDRPDLLTKAIAYVTRDR